MKRRAKELKTSLSSILKKRKTPKDAIQPTLIKEVAKGDPISQDYYVEVGQTAEFVRYFRTFAAVLRGNTTHAGMMDGLIEGSYEQGDCDSIIDIIPRDTTLVMAELNRRISGLESDLINEKNSNKAGALRQELIDRKDQQNRLRLKIEQLFNVGIQVTCSSLNLETLRKLCKSMVRQYAGQQIYLRPLDGRQLFALMNLTPLDTEEDFSDTKLDMETSHIADILPFGNGMFTHDSGIVLGQDISGRPILYDRKRLTNYNILIFGQTGFGKSVSAKKIVLRSSTINVRSFIIEGGGEWAWIRQIGFPYIELSADSPTRINVFDVEEEETDSGDIVVNLEESVKTVLNVVAKMIRTMDPRPDVITGPVKLLLMDYIWGMYDSMGINDDPESLYESVVNEDTFERKKKAMPTLSMLYNKISQDERLQYIANVLKEFTVHGRSASQSIFDCQTQGVDLLKSPVIGFSLNRLDKEIMAPIGQYVAMKYAWEKFGKKNRRQQKYLVIEEAQNFMYEEEDAIWLENCWRQARKFNTGMVGVTQGFEVFFREGYGLGILKNSLTKVMFRQEPLDIDAVKDKFAFTGGEGEFLLTADVAQALVKVDLDTFMLHVELMNEEYQLFNTNPNEL